MGIYKKFDKFEMSRRFGKWGMELYELCRGHDEREVKAHRSRKSISKENTFREDVTNPNELLPLMEQLKTEIEELLLGKYRDRKVRSLVVKLKFSDFTRTTAESAQSELSSEVFRVLLDEAWSRGEGKAVRLFGIGVRLVDEKNDPQLEMF